MKLTTDERNTECLLFQAPQIKQELPSSILAPAVDHNQLHLTNSASIPTVLLSGWHQMEP